MDNGNLESEACYPSPMKHRRPALFFALLLSLAGRKSNSSKYTVAAPASAGKIANANGNFDYYLLNLSWSPEFCHSHPSAAECAEHATFVLHGLWPQNFDGS